MEILTALEVACKTMWGLLPEFVRWPYERLADGQLLLFLFGFLFQLVTLAVLSFLLGARTIIVSRRRTRRVID